MCSRWPYTVDVTKHKTFHGARNLKNGNVVCCVCIFHQKAKIVSLINCIQICAGHETERANLLDL